MPPREGWNELLSRSLHLFPPSFFLVSLLQMIFLLPFFLPLVWFLFPFRTFFLDAFLSLQSPSLIIFSQALLSFIFPSAVVAYVLPPTSQHILLYAHTQVNAHAADKYIHPLHTSHCHLTPYCENFLHCQCHKENSSNKIFYWAPKIQSDNKQWVIFPPSSAGRCRTVRLSGWL